MDQKQNSMEAMIERYKAQLLDMKKQAGQRGVDPGVYTKKEPAAISEPEAVQAFQETQAETQEQQTVPAVPDTPEPDTAPQPESGTAPPKGWRSIPNERFSRLPEEAELTGQGYIKAQVSIASGAMPVAGAKVSIRQDGVELTASLTNQSGETEEIPLKAPPKALSEQYETELRPYSVYDVYTDKDGYVPVRNLNVPVFDGIVSIQGVSMRRLPDDYKGEEDVYDESASQE